MPPTARAPRRLPSWTWWLALAACVAGVVLVYAALVWSSAGQVLEYQVFRAVEERYADTVPDVASQVVRILPLALAVGMALASLGALAVARWRRRGLLALLVLVGSNLTTQLLKAALPRPEHADGVPWSGGNSLPSGHMTLATGAAVAALLLVPARWRPLTTVLGAVVSACTGAVAYTEAWHRPSDMAAAALVSAAWGLLAVPFARYD
ncbi:phosphatase PAP2 family protein, partial [Micrococcus luteus]|uniref:phosphatase PAP2 family protein n=2 Tax=Micrococcaceae TaxID=1268 RepID=UPI00214FB794